MRGNTIKHEMGVGHPRFGQKRTFLTVTGRAVRGFTFLGVNHVTAVAMRLLQGSSVQICASQSTPSTVP